ncbi:MAG: DNA repair protein RecN [Alphaproteobacteria bacterium]|nr:DNA repair protein RecN [Alphaproteobacteria bacterium]
MLVSLSIQNVVLIEALTVEFNGGLCTLTGETGAGKSILLDSLGLALGMRADTGLVRKGAQQAQVSAEFTVRNDHPVFDMLREASLAVRDDETALILRRSISAEGRSRAFINDQPVSVSLLREAGEALVEIHGQFETQGLLNPASHLRILDEYAQDGGSLPPLFTAWKEREESCIRLREEAGRTRAEEAYLRQALEDLDALDPQEGEEEALSGLRERLMHREQVLEALNTAYHILSGESDPVRGAWGALERIADRAGEGLEIALGALERASVEMQEALAAIQSLSNDLEESEYNLEMIDERLHALRAQARKHGCGVDDLQAVRGELAARLNRIEHEDEVLEAAVKEADRARKAYEAEAQRVSISRRKAAQALDKRVAEELPPLKLGKARFETHVETLSEEEWGPHGMDRVRFLVATNPGAEAGPLHKIASGGEMARFMLALKVVMAETGAAGTLIFDEVDSGIGGATADAVGERLAGLAAAKQVLVVTHAPQVAARAAHHYIVHKDGEADIRTSVKALSSRQERCEEIARMLSGADITAEARAAAGKLLETGT